MEYTVSELAKISGVSSRTLRYYDQIDLLKPGRYNSSGYRLYGQDEVDRLQQILFYKELGFGLADIKKAMADPAYNRIDALEAHYEQLKNERDRLNELLSTLEATIANQKGGITMQDDAKFTGFKEKLIQDNEETYGREIRDKYGDETIDAANAKLRGMGEADYNAMQETEEELFQLLKDAKQTGDPTSDNAHELAEKHKEWLMFSWSTYSKEAHAGLAEMYVADDRFRAYYDKKVEGGAAFLRDAIVTYAKDE